MNLTVIRSKDWVSIVDPLLGVGGAGKDYVEAFAAFGRSMHSYHTSDEWDEQFEKDVRSGKLDRLSKEAIKEYRTSIVKQDPSRIGSVSELMSDIKPSSKPDTGVPRFTEGMNSLEENVTRLILKEEGWTEVSTDMFTKTFEDKDGSKHTYKLSLKDAYARQFVEEQK